MRAIVVPLCVLMLALSPSLSLAADSQLMGIGTNSCAQFAQDLKADTSLEFTYFSWAQGYMSGMNVTLGSANASTKNLNARDVTDQMASIRAYCDSHPLQIYGRAAQDLYNSLPAK